MAKKGDKKGEPLEFDRSKPQFDGEVVYFEYHRKTHPQEMPNVYVWDIDKTYLNTHFETLRGLIRTAFEKAFQKVNVPGTRTLIPALLSSQSPVPPLYFISASPPQMETTLVQKMRLDGIEPLGIFFKDNLRNLRPKRFARLKHQVGFKVQALLQLQLILAQRVKCVLFGDDSESDAVVYNLFSDICARRIPNHEIDSVLTAYHVLPEQRAKIFELQSRIPIYDPVELIYINLISDTDPDYYSKFGRRTLATFTTFQTALHLYDAEKISDLAVINVGRDMISNFGFTPEQLAKNAEDLIKRTFFSQEAKTSLMPQLKEHGIIPENFEPAYRTQNTLKRIGESVLGIDFSDPDVPDHIDYLNDAR